MKVQMVQVGFDAKPPLCETLHRSSVLGACCKVLSPLFHMCDINSYYRLRELRCYLCQVK
jgi:hypothetical protein